MTISLSGLEAAIRNRVEIRDATSLPALINASIAQLYRLVANANAEWFLSPTPAYVGVVAGTQSYAFGVDAFAVNGVDVLDDSTWISMPRARWGARNAAPPTSTPSSAAYRLVGSRIFILPTPGWTQAAGLRLWYTPLPPVLTNVTPGTTDIWDTFAGWDEWVINKVALMYTSKEESDVTPWAAQLGELTRDILSQVSDRDMGEPDRIRNVRFERRYALAEDDFDAWRR